MSDGILDRVKSDDFGARVGFVATAPALRRLLNRTPEVHAIREALATGHLSEETIRRFVGTLMADLRRGGPFRHDLALSALAVALERRGTEFAGEYLRGLAGLRAAEMVMSIRVARECLKDREPSAGNLTAVVQLGPVRPSPQAPYTRGEGRSLTKVVQLSPATAVNAVSYEGLAERYPHGRTGETRQTGRLSGCGV
jgi:hypothetical protein